MLQGKIESEFYRQRSTKDGLSHACRLCYCARQASWAKANGEKVAKTKRRWNEIHKTSEAARKLDRTRWKVSVEDKRRWANVSKRNQRANPAFRASDNVRRAILYSLQKGHKRQRTFESLGYSREQLVAHLERQFSNGMCWDNYGKWHIDHIVPLASFLYDDTNDEEFRAAWALSNLRPLWAEENMEKKDKRTHLL